MQRHLLSLTRFPQKRTLRSFALGTVFALGSLSGGLAGCTQTSQTPSLEGNNSAATHTDHTAHHDLGPADETFDLRFIDAMILHHQGAIDMSITAIPKASRLELRGVAEAIINAQEQEIAQMQTWRKQWYPTAPAEPQIYHAEMGHNMAMTPEQQSAMRMDVELGAVDVEYDKRFLNAMIAHHEGALLMAEEAIAKSQRPEIRQLAKTILKTQDHEINQMKHLRKQWYGQ